MIIVEDITYLKEMARVGSFNSKGDEVDKGIDVRIYPENLGNPSFHLFNKNNWLYILEIKTFKILEIKDNGLNLNKGDYLPNSIVKPLIKFLSNNNYDNWYFLLKTWNANNPNYKISLNTKIPDSK